MKKTFKKVIVVVAVVVMLAGGIITLNGKIDPPLPPSTIFIK